MLFCSLGLPGIWNMPQVRLKNHRIGNDIQGLSRLPVTGSLPVCLTVSGTEIPPKLALCLESGLWLGGATPWKPLQKDLAEVGGAGSVPELHLGLSHGWQQVACWDLKPHEPPIEMGDVCHAASHKSVE